MIWGLVGSLVGDGGVRARVNGGGASSEELETVAVWAELVDASSGSLEGEEE